MTTDQALAYITFVIVAAGTPGPANVLVAATGAQVGLLRGVPCLLGVTVGAGTLLGAVAMGLGTMLMEQPRLLHALKFAGAAMLLWLAWRIATAPAMSSINVKDNKPVGFLPAALLQWINPKPWLVAVSAAGTYLNPSSTNTIAQAMVFTVLFIAAATPAVGVWLVAGAAISRALSSERKGRAFNLIMGLLLAASVILVFT